ncbi:Aspartic proteinase Asp1 [Linum perenne]
MKGGQAPMTGRKKKKKKKSFYVILQNSLKSLGELVGSKSFTIAADQTWKKGTTTTVDLMSNLVGRGYELELRFYSVSIRIGNPLKVFDLDIDIGSDLIWVQCDAPCTGCTKAELQV